MWSLAAELARLFGDTSSRRRRLDMPDYEGEERAMQLLKANLSPRQREQFETLGHFDVIGGHTRHRYRIRRGRQMNVELLGAYGRPHLLLCFMPKGRLPLADVMLAQKIALECFESEVLGVAHRAAVLNQSLLYCDTWYVRARAESLRSQTETSGNRTIRSMTFTEH